MQDDPIDFRCPPMPDLGGADVEHARSLVAGVEWEVPLLDGRQTAYVNFDNAATTPPFTTVIDALQRFFQWYGSVHRGTGFKSRLSTRVYERCREVVAEFVGADLSHQTLVFVQNATHALNKLAARICLPEGRAVLCTTMEHHSNMLPWRRLGCRLDYVHTVPRTGELNMQELEEKVRLNAGCLCLMTVTGASNVTGYMPDIRRIARLVHAQGALLAVDATQLVPRRPLRLGAPDDPERIDFTAFSAHKMYAPFGSGVLIGPRRVFEQGVPDMVGGGTIHAVTMDEVLWAAPPGRDEAGTPNVPGSVALATACRTLQALGMANVAEHERDLTRRTLRGMRDIPGVTVYGDADPNFQRDRLGVICFNLDGLNHARTAAALGHEWGIGVRNGCFCAQPYVRELLGLSEEEVRRAIARLTAGDHSSVPGLVRASFGVYNTTEEVDHFLEALRSVAADGPRVRYVVDDNSGDYVPAQQGVSLDSYVPF